ncbi:MAG: flagellar hook-associated protein 3 [Lachnospiraceae bacterium]|nr:flagellar hook-associated protein 3 [Lachnospiraceae bacterium]
MSMRITNSIMNNNTKNNININKLNEDRQNTMIATGQKITRPSDDPVVAIRALRLNSNISQSNQYYDKNIPDADAWLKITETALTQTDTVLAKIKESLTQGASDDNTPEDRMNILADLRGMRDQIYASGNADYADRTVFTGYRTGVMLTFMKPEKALYSIREEFTADSISQIKHVSGDFDVDKTGADLGTPITQQDVEENTLYRIRLAYDGIVYPQTATLKYNLGGEQTVTLNVVEFADDAAYAKPATGATLIAETGEIILSDDLRDELQDPAVKDIALEYDKENWKKNDLRPEHYFQCIDKTANPADPDDPKNIKYNYTDPDGNPLDHFQNQKISYEISFNQTIVINTNANQVYTHDICRDVDELITATQAVIDADNKLDDLKKMAENTDRYSEAQIEEIKNRIVAMTKERDLRADKMQAMFSKGLTTFDYYADRNNLALTEAGSTRKRVELTKERMQEQLTNFKDLADSNININLTDAAIDLSNAQLALEAAQMAAGKVAKQTLLNYI